MRRAATVGEVGYLTILPATLQLPSLDLARQAHRRRLGDLTTLCPPLVDIIALLEEVADLLAAHLGGVRDVRSEGWVHARAPPLLRVACAGPLQELAHLSFEVLQQRREAFICLTGRRKSQRGAWGQRW
jgi:hypothetical protein